MSELRYTDVFVPGGFPRHTYNPRLDLQLESTLEQVRHNLCKLVTVTGHTKSGKTVLVRKILPREDSIWIDGGSISDEEDFWQVVLDQLDLFQRVETQKNDEIKSGIIGSVEGGANFAIVSGKSAISGTVEANTGSGITQSRELSSKVAAILGLRKEMVPIVIDDYHYLPKKIQGNIIRALKPLIFDGLPVVIIAIPHRRYDAIKVEREMTGRILSIPIPPWSIDELTYISKVGFEHLNSSINENMAHVLAGESIGSPHLMQDFCRKICELKGIISPSNGSTISLEKSDSEIIFNDIAENIGRPIFEKLAQGPRARTDRKARLLKSGVEVDIYRLVLYALAHLKPGLVSFEYEQLRTAIKDITEEGMPTIQDVARVLKHMSEIAATDQSSTPVIDFDEEEKRLHVTDPFFAFYLRWGKLEN
jgi:hypothetical protein